MKCSIFLPFSPGSCLCSCASNQEGGNFFSSVTVTYFCFFHVDDVEASSKDDEGGWWEGPGQAKPEGKGKGTGKGTGKEHTTVFLDYQLRATV